jgi:hypothetical protein
MFFVTTVVAAGFSLRPSVHASLQIVGHDACPEGFRGLLFRYRAVRVVVPPFSALPALWLPSLAPPPVAGALVAFGAPRGGYNVSACAA